MGDMADFYLDSTLDDFYGESDDLNCYVRRRRVLRCRQCGKPNLNWRMIQDRWVMFEKDGKVHTCGGYEPPIEILKELAKEVVAETREGLIWRLMDKAKKRGGMIKLLPILPDDQLIDLYACFIRDDCGEPDFGMSIGYEREIKMLKEEILKRMLK